VGTLTEPIRVMSQHPELVEQQSRLSAAAMAERVVSVKDLVIIDVRNPGEVENGAIAGAKLISLPALIKNLDGLDKNAPTIVYCAGGYRSSIASSLLKSHGFKDVSDLLGGFQAWQLAAGYSVTEVEKLFLKLS
jgi:hydroxyacylglutathione hydrolase